MGNVVGTIDALGRLTRFSHDLNNKKTRTVNAIGNITAFVYDANGNQTATIWPDQNQIRYFYDALNRKIGKLDELGFQQWFEYDGIGNLIQHTDAMGYITTYEYDAANRLVKKIDASGNEERIEYDEADRKLQLTNARAVVTGLEYDVHGNLVKQTMASGTDDASVIRFQYDDNNRKTHEIRELVVDETTTRDLVAEFQYDDRGLLRFRIDGQHLGTDAEVREFRYNAKRELHQEVDPKGTVTTYSYDKTGRKIKTSITTAANGLQEHSWEYDKTGNIILETFPEGETIDRGYDDLGRLNFILMGTDQRHIAYDSRGRLIQETDFNDIITTYEYDAAGRLTIKTVAVGTTDEAETSYSYDGNGNVLIITNAREKTISYQYNELNRKIRKTDSDATNQNFTYYVNGELETIERQDDTVVRYIRDNLDRIVEIQADDVQQQTFGYDTLSRMTLATDNNEGRNTRTVTFVYNDLNRPETETQDSYTVSRQYDDNGNKTKITYPSGKVVDKGYDENNMLDIVLYQGSTVAQATHDKNSRLAYASYGNNTDLSLGYDPARGREDFRSVTTPFADPLFNVSNMVYDGQSNTTNRTETFNGIQTTEEMDYDHQDRLISFTKGTDPAQTWQYDLVGNWESTNQNGAAETRTVNDDNEYNLIGSLVPAHDNRGNMTSDGTQDYLYDWANRLVKVTSGTQTLAEYTYDALNRRVTKTIDTSTTTYVYDDGDVVETYDNGNLVRAFVFGGSIDDPVLMEYNGQTYYYARDILGSIKAITDSTGSLVESYEYNPFGLMTIFDSTGQDITAAGSAIGNPYGYTGRRWDAESGLWYYRNRMYSAFLGRFMQRDPAGYVDGLNLYAYVLNNPLRYTDPDGLVARTPEWYNDGSAFMGYSDGLISSSTNTNYALQRSSTTQQSYHAQIPEHDYSIYTSTTYEPWSSSLDLGVLEKQKSNNWLYEESPFMGSGYLVADIGQTVSDPYKGYPNINRSYTTISIGYTPTPASGFYHQYILLEDTYTGEQFATRAGPSKENRLVHIASSSSGGSFSASIGYGGLGGYGAGQVISEAGPYDDNFPDKKDTLFVQLIGTIKRSYKESVSNLIEFSDVTNKRKIPYLIYNSNSYATTGVESLTGIRPEPVSPLRTPGFSLGKPSRNLSYKPSEFIDINVQGYPLLEGDFGEMHKILMQ